MKNKVKNIIQVWITISYMAIVALLVLKVAIILSLLTVLFGLPWHWLENGSFKQAVSETRLNVEYVIDKLLSLLN